MVNRGKIGERWRLSCGGRVLNHALFGTETFHTTTVGNKTSGSKGIVITAKVARNAICESEVAQAHQSRPGTMG